MTLAGINFAPALPEIFLLCAVSLLLVADLFIADSRRLISFLSALLILLITGALLVMGIMDGDAIQITLQNMFVADRLSQTIKLIAVITVLGILLLSPAYLRARHMYKGEFFSLMLFALFGLFVLVSATNFLVMYVGLELLALSTYALVALARDNAQSTEAAMKYFVLGALASGMLLFGMSMLYGATGHLGIPDVASVLVQGGANATLAKLGLVFVVAGLGFKFGAAPFHMWVPDVYHGAPTPVTLFISSAPKLAAFVFLTRVLVQALPSLHGDWYQMLLVLAITSIAIGNLFAVSQTNFKRLLAYSAISHMGFVLLGVMTGTNEGYSAAMFYVVSYMPMTLLAFGLILALSRAGFEADQLADLKGLAQRNPMLGFALLVVMFSMAGIPSTVGFMAKLSVLDATVGSGYIVSAITVVLLSVIGAFYYLRIVKLAYFDAPAEDAEPLTISWGMQSLLMGLSLSILAFGIYPDPVMALCKQAIALSFPG